MCCCIPLAFSSVTATTAGLSCYVPDPEVSVGQLFANRQRFSATPGSWVPQRRRVTQYSPRIAGGFFIVWRAAEISKQRRTVIHCNSGEGALQDGVKLKTGERVGMTHGCIAV